MRLWLLAGAGAIAVLVAGVLVGLWIGQRGPVVEAAAPGYTQSDGSQVARREPGAPVKPAMVPKGHKAVRVVEATIQSVAPGCPPVRCSVTLARDDKGAHRAIVSSDGGEVLDSIDVPLAEAMAPQRRWAAGVSWEPVNGLGGAWVERDLWRLRVGAEVQQTRAGDLEARVRVGWSF